MLQYLSINSWINGGHVHAPRVNLGRATDAENGIGWEVVSALNLRNANLSDVDVGGYDLCRVDFMGADLRRAQLQGSDLSEANLIRADLRGADLRECRLYNTTLRGAQLAQADLTGATLGHTDLFLADLRGARHGNSRGGDDIIQRCITSADRGDYEFYLFRIEGGGHRVKAGCQWMSLAAYHAHVNDEYPDTERAHATIAILNYFEARIA